MITENAEVSPSVGTVGTIEVRGVCRPGYLTVALPGRAEAVPAVRSLLRRSLGDDATPDVLICASELASNAVEHTRSGLPGGRFLVTAQVEGGGVVRVGVLDEGARTPQGRPAWGLPEEHGRGLGIVAALSIESGATPAFAGRLAWFRISVRDAAAGGSNHDARRDGIHDARHDAAHDGRRDAALTGGRS